MKALEKRCVFNGVIYDPEKNLEIHRHRLKGVKKLVDNDQPSGYHRAQSPNRKQMAKKAAKDHIYRENYFLAKRIFDIMEGQSSLNERINDTRHLDNHPGTMNFKSRLTEAQRIHHNNMLLAMRLNNIQPFYKKSDIQVVKRSKIKTPRDNKKKTKFFREFEMSLKSANNENEFSQTDEFKNQYTGNEMGKTSKSVDAAYINDYSHSHGRPRSVLLEYTKVQDDRVLDVAVIKEPYRDRYAIFAKDIDDGQRFELRLTSEDVSNILDGDILVTSVDNVEVWMALLNKVRLQEVSNFTKLPISSEEVDNFGKEPSVPVAPSNEFRPSQERPVTRGMTVSNGQPVSAVVGDELKFDNYIGQNIEFGEEIKPLDGDGLSLRNSFEKAENDYLEENFPTEESVEAVVEPLATVEPIVDAISEITEDKYSDSNKSKEKEIPISEKLPKIDSIQNAQIESKTVDPIKQQESQLENLPKDSEALKPKPPSRTSIRSQQNNRGKRLSAGNVLKPENPRPSSGPVSSTAPKKEENPNKPIKSPRLSISKPTKTEETETPINKVPIVDTVQVNSIEKKDSSENSNHPIEQNKKEGSSNDIKEVETKPLLKPTAPTAPKQKITPNEQRKSINQPVRRSLISAPKPTQTSTETSNDQSKSSSAAPPKERKSSVDFKSPRESILKQKNKPSQVPKEQIPPQKTSEAPSLPKEVVKNDAPKLTEHTIKLIQEIVFIASSNALSKLEERLTSTKTNTNLSEDLPKEPIILDESTEQVTIEPITLEESTEQVNIEPITLDESTEKVTTLEEKSISNTVASLEPSLESNKENLSLKNSTSYLEESYQEDFLSTSNADVVKPIEALESSQEGQSYGDDFEEASKDVSTL